MNFAPHAIEQNFSDNQSVVIYRIMIQHIVLLKVARIIHKIIIDCEISYFDGRASDN